MSTRPDYVSVTNGFTMITLLRRGDHEGFLTLMDSSFDWNMTERPVYWFSVASVFDRFIKRGVTPDDDLIDTVIGEIIQMMYDTL